MSAENYGFENPYDRPDIFEYAECAGCLDHYPIEDMEGKIGWWLCPLCQKEADEEEELVNQQIKAGTYYSRPIINTNT